MGYLLFIIALLPSNGGGMFLWGNVRSDDDEALCLLPKTKWNVF